MVPIVLSILQCYLSVIATRSNELDGYTRRSSSRNFSKAKSSCDRERNQKSQSAQKSWELLMKKYRPERTGYVSESEHDEFAASYP